MRACLAATAFVRDGELRLARQDAFSAALRRMPNCRALVRVEQHLDPRSLALNAFWWGVLIHKISERTGMSEMEAHDEMKQLHLSKALVALRGRGRIVGPRVFEGTTTDLSGGETWQLIERVYQWSAETIGLVLPYPNEDVVEAA